MDAPAPDRSNLPPVGPLDGTVRSAISQAIVRIHAEHYGKGATRAKTHASGDLVVVLLREVLTTAERTLVDAGRADTVREVRMTFQDTMEPLFREALERLTGRRVWSFMSQIDPVRGTGAEIFVLEPLDDRADAAG